MKREFREQFMGKRKSLSPEIRREKDQLIFQRLIDSFLYQENKNIFIFVSSFDEVNTHPMIEQALKDGKKVSVPKVMGKEMVAIEIKSLSELSPGTMGILEPTNEQEMEKIDLCVTPGLAFDKKGYRIGYGGGYYDKFIGKHQEMITLGIGYDLQWTEEVPHEAYDRPLDYFLSESRWEKLG
ncbi:MAG: 5-formyltetrahydrofolate cyclo-ligase [Tissierellia bacterium]|nr:5-formyltetrahydrofolate cyclo-ligase [Tissierellia bacterium]